MKRSFPWRSQAVPDIAAQAFDQKFVQFILQVLATAHLSDAATIMSQIQKDKVTFEGEPKLIVNHGTGGGSAVG